jgi:hypothetical protein
VTDAPRRPVIGDMVLFMPPFDWQKEHGAGPWAAVVTSAGHDQNGASLGNPDHLPVLITAFPPGSLPGAVNACIVYDSTGRELTWTWPRGGHRGPG